MNAKRTMDVAQGVQNAELVLKNAQIINVFTGDIELSDIAIDQGMIVGIGDYQGNQTIDLNHAYVAPGCIDGHVHIESSMVTPPAFAKLVVPKGTTSVIADPHEIGNVSGVAGIEYMIESAKDIPLNVFIMAPSCVPATAFENAGAVITNDDIEALKQYPEVIGLGEVMDYVAVLEGDASIHQKINTMRPRPIDGHAPDIMDKALNAYISAGVQTDHECTQLESLKARVKRGMYVHLREGSATRNLKTLLNGITPMNHHRLLFCTDDKHPEDILKEGHINWNINVAIQAGINPIMAIRMATINTAQCYQLKQLGAVAPGYRADLIVFNALERIEPHLVFKDGMLVAKDQEALFEVKPKTSNAVLNTMHIDPNTIDLTLKLKQSKVHVIGLIENNITTKKLIREVTVKNGVYHNDPDQDILKLAVIERHQSTGNVGIGLVEGYGIKNGAIALSIAHDSHNIIVIGDDDDSMHLAIQTLYAMQGGIAVVNKNQVVGKLPLEISGIMTNQDPHDVSKIILSMTETIESMGLNQAIDDPFITLAFLSLPVIPELKLTDTGLFDVHQFKIIPVEASDES